ncbi:hypothetical protein KR074_001011 [Drosophila pseudoananassae]|nr:hypothetical protein KR074_001011 [Drosophila pseudoananassae]
MGSKATKMEGEYLPDTPTLNKMRQASQKKDNLEMTPTRDQLNPLDPRSPNVCRTPLNFLQTEPTVQDFRDANPVVQSENAFSQLRKRLLKGFSLNDPRSPQLNRTPLVLDEVRSLNMDDTFADLFVDTRAPSSRTEDPATPSTIDSVNADESCDSFGTPPMEHNNSSLEIVSLPYDEEETMPCEAKLQTTPPQLHVDPRSPSVGVDRTPIIFCDDEEEEAREAQMLEQILETLTLNLSTDSSMASFAFPPNEANLEDSFLPSNKHLERVRLGHKRRIPPQKPARANKPKIFVDQESPVVGGASTMAKSNDTPLSAQKRTPLSCVKNREHLRSQSVDKDLRQTPLAQKNQQKGQFNQAARHGRRLITGDALNG